MGPFSGAYAADFVSLAEKSSLEIEEYFLNHIFFVYSNQNIKFFYFSHLLKLILLFFYLKKIPPLLLKELIYLI